MIFNFPFSTFNLIHAAVAKLAYAQDLGSCALWRAGSTPVSRTTSEWTLLHSDFSLQKNLRSCPYKITYLVTGNRRMAAESVWKGVEVTQNKEIKEMAVTVGSDLEMQYKFNIKGNRNYKNFKKIRKNT